MGAKQTSDEIKALKRRIGEKRTELQAAQEVSREKKARVRDIEEDIANLQRRVDELQEEVKDPVVTDHAVMRYLERVKGLNLDEVRAEILNEKTVELIRFTRSGKVPIGGRHRLVVDNMAVVSVL